MTARWGNTTNITGVIDYGQYDDGHRIERSQFERDMNIDPAQFVTRCSVGRCGRLSMTQTEDGRPLCSVHHDVWRHGYELGFKSGETLRRGGDTIRDMSTNERRDDLAQAVQDLYERERSSAVAEDARRWLEFWRDVLDSQPHEGALRFVRRIDDRRYTYVTLKIVQPDDEPTWYLTGSAGSQRDLVSGVQHSTGELIGLLTEWRVDEVDVLGVTDWRGLPVRPAVEATSRSVKELKKEGED